MRKLIFVTFCLAIVAVFANSTSAQVLIAAEDFDGGDVNLTSTTNVHSFPGLGGDFSSVFGTVCANSSGGGGMPRAVADDTVANVSGTGGPNASDNLGVAGQNTSCFFAMDDMDGSPVPGFTFATWTFDISTATSGISDVQIDLAAMGDFEASQSDGFVIEAQIDGGGYQEIFRASPDESANKTYRAMDVGSSYSLNDPLELFIDGSATAVGFLDKSDATTGDFDTYTSTLFTGQTGSSMDIRITWAGVAEAFEPVGVDNITINGLTTVDPVCPDSHSITTGNLHSGGTTDLCASDNQYLVMNPIFSVFRYQLIFTVDATSPTETPSALEFSYESKTANVVGTVDQKLELYNFDTGQYEVVDNRLTSGSDTTVSITPTGDPTRFVETGTGTLRARISYQNSFAYWVFDFSALFLPYRTSVDHIFWQGTPYGPTFILICQSPTCVGRAFFMYRRPWVLFAFWTFTIE